MGEVVYGLACPAYRRVKRLAPVIRNCAQIDPAIPHPPILSPTHSDSADWKTAENDLFVLCCWGQMLTENISVL